MSRKSWINWTILGLLLFTPLSVYKRWKAMPPRNVFYYNAGYILTSESTDLKHQFTFTNVQNEPLEIRHIMKSCSCTDATIDKRVIEPNASAHINMYVRLTNVFRQHKLYCTIESNSAKTPRLQYEIDFTTLPRVAVEPSMLTVKQPPTTIAGPAGSTNPIGSNVVVSFFFGASVRPTFPVRLLSPPYLNVEAVESGTPVALQPNTYKATVKLAISVRPNHSAIPNGPSYVRVDGGQGFQTSIPITVKASGEPSIVIPASLNFGIVTNLNHELRQSFVVKHEGRVVRVQTPSPELKLIEAEITPVYTRFDAVLNKLPTGTTGQAAKGVFSGDIVVQLDSGRSYNLPWMVLIR